VDADGGGRRGSRCAAPAGSTALVRFSGLLGSCGHERPASSAASGSLRLMRPVMNSPAIGASFATLPAGARLAAFAACSVATVATLGASAGFAT
jgi:hypothetical protein